jgi:hypothetical protein
MSVTLALLRSNDRELLLYGVIYTLRIHSSGTYRSSSHQSLCAAALDLLHWTFLTVPAATAILPDSDLVSRSQARDP